MRCGLLGGTFDPFHNGHLALAAAAMHGLKLDGVWLIPTGLPWMKRTAPRSPGSERLAMLELAAADKPRLHVLTLELDRPGESYTVDTLEELSAGEMAGDELFFLVGADALASMNRWKDPARIFELATVVAVPRDGRHPSLRELESATRLARASRRRPTNASTKSCRWSSSASASAPATTAAPAALASPYAALRPGTSSAANRRSRARPRRS